jgi:hypothetical protein
MQNSLLASNGWAFEQLLGQQCSQATRAAEDLLHYPHSSAAKLQGPIADSYLVQLAKDVPSKLAMSRYVQYKCTASCQ